MQHTAPTIGQTVILVRSFGAKPELVTVARVTKTGQFFLAVPGLEKCRFKPFGVHLGSHRAYKRDTPKKVYAYSETALANLMQTYEGILADKAAREAKEKAKQEEREKEYAEKLATVKAKITIDKLEKIILPDGSRLYQGMLPIINTDALANKGFELLIVRCTDSKRYDFVEGVEKPTVDTAYTYMTQRAGGFASCSSYGHTDDEAAVYAAIIDLYFRTW